MGTSDNACPVRSSPLTCLGSDFEYSCLFEANTCSSHSVGFFLAFLLLVITSPLSSQISVNMPPSLPLCLPPRSLGAWGSWEVSEGIPLFLSSCTCHNLSSPLPPTFPPPDYLGPRPPYLSHHGLFPHSSSPLLPRGSSFFLLKAKLLLFKELF